MQMAFDEWLPKRFGVGDWGGEVHMVQKALGHGFPPSLTFNSEDALGKCVWYLINLSSVYLQIWRKEPYQGCFCYVPLTG
jgi:hypothetical protein